MAAVWVSMRPVFTSHSNFIGVVISPPSNMLAHAFSIALSPSTMAGCSVRQMSSTPVAGSLLGSLAAFTGAALTSNAASVTILVEEYLVVAKDRGEIVASRDRPRLGIDLPVTDENTRHASPRQNRLGLEASCDYCPFGSGAQLPMGTKAAQ